jgi:hypothetical protein
LIIANDVIISLNDNDFNLRASNSYEGIDYSPKNEIEGRVEDILFYSYEIT